MGVVIAGGDIVASPAALALHVTAIGQTCGGRYLARSGARPGDVIGVSGTLGAAAAGYRLLRDGGPRRLGATADLLIAAHLRPEPRVQFGQLLLQGGATAAMDLSDGLFGDLPKILAASGVGARLDEAAIPVAAAVRALFPDELARTRHPRRRGLRVALYRAAGSVRADRGGGRPTAGSTVTSIGEVMPADPRDGPLVTIVVRRWRGARGRRRAPSTTLPDLDAHRPMSDTARARRPARPSPSSSTSAVRRQDRALSPVAAGSA